jgi:hypothetical protein
MIAFARRVWTYAFLYLEGGLQIPGAMNAGIWPKAIVLASTSTSSR